jgi:hypothetical protein
MGIETVSPTSPSPDLTPSESAQEVRQDSSHGPSESTLGTGGDARLERLSSLLANRPGNPAGPSQARMPRTDALAKLARTSGAATAPHMQAAMHMPLAQTATAPTAPTHADVAAVRRRTQNLSAKEAQLAALKQLPEPPRSEGERPSEAEIVKLIDMLEAKRGDAQRNISVLSQQCKTAFDSMARHGIALARKVDLLEQKQAQLDEAGPVAVAPARTGPSAAAPSVPDRLAALEQAIGSLKGSQKKAAEEALTVASRDKLRELGTWSMTQFSTNFITATARKILGKGGPVDVQLEQSIDAWLHDWMPAPPRNRHGRYATPAEQFTRGLKATFEDIAKAAGPEATGADAAKALGKLLHLLSNLECHGLGAQETARLARHFAICLIVNKLSNTPFIRSRTGQAAAYLSPDQGGHNNEKITVAGFVDQVEHARTEFNKADRRAGVSSGTELFKDSRLTTAKNQLNQLAAHLEPNRESLEAVLKAVERQLIEDLKSTAPNEDRHDDIEEMGRKIAPHLGPVYGDMIKRLNVDREKLAKVPVRRAAPPREIAEANPASRPGRDRHQLEIDVFRLRGAVIEYEHKHRETFERHATLGGKRLDASDALEDIERQLDEAHGALQDVRDGKRRALGESAARGQQAASLEQEIDIDWREALADPALSRLISPMALARAQKMHVGQTPAQMRARVRKDDRTARTGTFRSPPELLRTIADIAEHELGRPDSPLRAASREAFMNIARRHPGGRVNALLDHGRTIGHGLRASDPADAPPARTGTSQYAIEWADGEGARISHLHPWVSPY